MTSRAEKCSKAAFTALKQSWELVTSNRMGKICSLYCSTKSSISLRFRAVAATRSPRKRAASAHARPNPFEVPVISHVLLIYVVPLIWLQQPHIALEIVEPLLYHHALWPQDKPPWHSNRLVLC